MEEKQYNAKKMVVVLDFLIVANKILKEYDLEYRDAILYQIKGEYYSIKEESGKSFANPNSIQLLKTLIDLKADIIP